MNRYFSSFIISAISYFIIIFSLIYIIKADSQPNTDAKVQDVRKVSFTIIAKSIPLEKKQEKKVTPEPIPEPKPEPKPIQKPIPKPKPEPIKKPIVKEEVVQEEVQESVEETQEEIVEAVESMPSKEDVIVEKQSEISQDILLAKQNKFINDLIKKINDNKSYPNMARRRGIEGIVDVKFKVLSDGNVEGMNVVSGNNIFAKSALEAISKSFPVSVEETLFKFPKEFRVKLSYTLK